MSIVVPAQTKIYLTREPPHEIFLKPDTTLANDSLYVLYDIRLPDGTPIIPRGTRAIGDWVTESSPTISAQLQLTKICLNGESITISADSDVFESLIEYNNTEVNNSNVVQQVLFYQSTANIERRIVKFPCQIRVLLDERLNTEYIQIFAKEVSVTLLADLVI